MTTYLDFHLSLSPGDDAVPTFETHHVFSGSRTHVSKTLTAEQLDHLISALQRLRLSQGGRM